MSVKDNIENIRKELPSTVKLVAVSKFHPVEEIMEAYNVGQRVFGENRPQEFAQKVPQLPDDIEWHFIGHLQTNKLRYVLPYADMIQSVDSLHLLESIEAWCSENGKTVNVLLELHLGAEETKHGLSEDEIFSVLGDPQRYPHVIFCGLMGMATNTPDQSIVAADFERIFILKNSVQKKFPALKEFRELSIGMSGDYRLALSHGATMVRIGTSIFGPRRY